MEDPVSGTPRRRALTVGAAGLLAAAVAVPAAAVGGTSSATVRQSRHVLLLSVDGMHQSDLDWYVRTHPHSTLAALTRGGIEYTHARTPVPSDSFPGLIAQVTGGQPASTGVYYDVSFNHSLLPPGTRSCTGAGPGAVVAYDESLDRDTDRLDAGQGLRGLPGSILRMTPNPRALINPAGLPVDPTACSPGSPHRVYPHSYLKVNTVFEVARAAGLRTAWSDKHPAYDIVNGPSGRGVQDLFTPEINSLAPARFPAGDSWTDDNGATIQYDSYKVRAVENEIDGFEHSGRQRVGTPAIFGMNFQAVSTAQKLPTSDGLTGGYLPGGVVPGPLLTRALNFVNSAVGALVAHVDARHLSAGTTIILSAKHGQSPMDPSALTRIDDGPILDSLNAAWKRASAATTDLVAAASDDDGMLLWLSDRRPAAAAFAARYLRTHPATGNTIAGGSRTLPSAGLRTVYAGPGAAAYLHTPRRDPRHPDVVGIAIPGVVYTGGTSKIAEHGGADPQDRDVPLLVSNAGRYAGRVTSSVGTTQIAPTILALLGLDPQALQAVRKEHTAVLPRV
jgi:Type I phosphodiesterase / nucleotide pyrophosphatase